MNEINFKQGKITNPIKEFLIEQGVYKYEINGLDMGTSVVLYKKELGIFEAMPKGDFIITYENGNQYITITNETVFKDYLSIQIVSIKKLISSMYEPSGDIDLNILLHELNNCITDVHDIVDYMKKTNQVTDSEKATNVFPDLPIGSTVIKLEDGTLGGIPISDMYEHFDRLTQRIYNEVKDMLEIDYQGFRNGLLQYSQELEVSIKAQIDIYVANAFLEFDQKVVESGDAITQKGEEILAELAQFDPTGLVDKVDALEKNRVLRTGDQMTGDLMLINPSKITDGVGVYVGGAVGITNIEGNPNINFQTGLVHGYVGAVHSASAMSFHNYVANNYFRINNNGTSELYSGLTMVNSYTGDGAFKLRNEKSVGLSWWNASRIVFDNDNREAIFTGLGNQGLFIFQTSVGGAYPTFRMVRGDGTSSDVNIVDTTNLLYSINSNYLSRAAGGTIAGAVDVQGAHSANLYYSRGAITAAGAIASSSNVTAYSDIRLKENIKPLDNCLELIQKLDVYNYNWKDTGKKDIGVIAQEVEKVFPEFVVEVQDEINGTVKTVDYGKLATVCLKGIKELIDTIQDVRKEIEVIRGGQNSYVTQNR